MKKMPVLFVGHGSPMIALEDSDLTRKFREVGDEIIEKFQSPKALLVISAHWYTNDTFIQSDSSPRQIYDMYGFPEELYQLKYPALGDIDLTNRVKELLGDSVDLNDQWGIDHGTWSVLVHMFPKADIPVVQLSVNRKLDERESFKLGEKLSPLRDEGYLIIGSGNIVHNLREANFHSDKGSIRADEFDEFILENVLNKNYENILNYEENKNSFYAVPTKDHFLPFIYSLGASLKDDVEVFNNLRTLDSISMTSYVFGMTP